MYLNGTARGCITQAIPELLLPYTLFTDSKKLICYMQKIINIMHQVFSNNDFTTF